MTTESYPLIGEPTDSGYEGATKYGPPIFSDKQATVESISHTVIAVLSRPQPVMSATSLLWGKEAR